MDKMTKKTLLGMRQFGCNYQGIVEIGYALGVGEYGMNNLKLNLNIQIDFFEPG